ncbi:hypothetical protein GCM10020255_009390 [Rhodococcus baikonurensis]
MAHGGSSADDTPPAKTIDARLARRGWLRLIAPAPFALVNYCSGLSAVRPLPYTAATVVGTLPGTVRSSVAR